MTDVAFLITSEAAALLRVSPRVVHAWTSERSVPHRRLPGTRRCLFIREELERWALEAGQVELEVEELERGGRIVRLKAGSNT